MLSSAVTAAATVCEESSYEPWSNMLPEKYEATVVDLKKAYDAVVVRRKNARDNSETLFGMRSVESSQVGEPSCWTGVRISDVVKVGQVEYLCESILAPNQTCSRTKVPPRSPGKGKRKKSAAPAPADAPKRLFEIVDESIVLRKEKGSVLMTRTLKLH